MNEAIQQQETQGNGVLPCVSNRTFKCFGCKFYAIKVTNGNGGTTKICNVKPNDIRAIVDLDATTCTDYVCMVSNSTSTNETKLFN